MKSEEFATATPPAPTPEDIALKFKPDGVTDEEWIDHSAIMRAIQTWKLEHAEDEPLLDPIELQDPRVRVWREKIRQGCNFIKNKI